MEQQSPQYFWNMDWELINQSALLQGNEPRTGSSGSNSYTGELGIRPAAVVWGRRWVSPSLRCFCLHSSLFLKKRRGELGPGRRAAAIIGKLTEMPLSHTQSAHKFIRTWAISVAAEAYFRRNITAIGTNSPLSRVCGRPSIMWAQQWTE